MNFQIDVYILNSFTKVKYLLFDSEIFNIISLYILLDLFIFVPKYLKSFAAWNLYVIIFNLIGNYNFFTSNILLINGNIVTKNVSDRVVFRVILTVFYCLLKNVCNCALPDWWCNLMFLIYIYIYLTLAQYSIILKKKQYVWGREVNRRASFP